MIEQLLRELVRNQQELARRVAHLEAAELGIDIPVPVTARQKIGLKRCNSTLNLTNNYQGVPNCTATLTVPANETAIVLGIFDFGMQYASSTNILMGALDVAGSRQTPLARYQGTAIGGVGTVAQVWIVTLVAGGNRTIKLEAKRTAAGTGDWCFTGNTTLFWMRPDTAYLTNES